MDLEARMWDYIARSAKNEIEAGGWKNSYDGKLFSEEEMREYAEDVYIKLKPYLSKTETSCLEIGCASGITMFKIAPFVKHYIGSDMSQVNLEKNEHRIQKENIENIRIVNCKADEIHLFSDENVDIVIMNSVCQYFGTKEYFNDVIKKCIGILKKDGIIYIGDVRDAGKKKEFEKSVEDYNSVNRGGKGEEQQRNCFLRGNIGIE